MAPDSAGTERDAADLRRSMRITLVGYVTKIAYPLLLIVVLRLYGAGPYGVFALVLAILNFVLRVALLGLDKGLLLWIPRQQPGREREGLRAVLVTVVALNAVAALLIATVLAPWIAHWAEKPSAVTTLRWMAASLVPMALMEVFIQTANARRRTEGQILIKDGLVAMLFVVLAVVFHYLGAGSPGLALAHTASVVVGLLALLILFARHYPGSPWTGHAVRPPIELVRLARPLWLTEMLASAFNRFDVFVLAALADPVVIGMFQASMQVAQNVLAIRASFDHLVIVLVTEIHRDGDRERLTRGFSYTLRLIATIVVPLAAGLFALAPWILPLVGPEFVGATSSVWILVAFFTFHGILGLNQNILIGAGRSVWVPLDTFAAMAVGGLAYFLLVPRLALDGAALATGLMYATLSLLFIVQAPRALGYWPYDRSLVALLVRTAAAAAVMASLWFGLEGPLGELARLVGLLAFLAVFLPGLRRPAAASQA